MASLESMPWVGDWAWGVPLIVANFVMHVLGLSLIGAFVLGDYASILRNRKAPVDFMMVVGVTAVLTILLHGLESMTWGVAYVLLGALTDKKTAMLYSVGAMTTLWSREHPLDSTVGAVGCDGGPARDVVVRTDHGIFVLDLRGGKRHQDLTNRY
jgi:hypothetical protein